MDIVVKKSAIHGKGVFANRDFKKGEIVLRWDTSHRLTKEQAEKLRKAGDPNIAFLNGVYLLVQEPERYVNHSCEANTSAKNFSDVAIRDIRKGEEITADYSQEGAPGMNMECHCGSRNCRGIIQA